MSSRAARRALPWATAVVVTAAGCTLSRDSDDADPGASNPWTDVAAAEALRDTGPDPVTLPGVVPGEPESVPSALDDPTSLGLPAPLVDVARLVPGGPPPDGIPAIDEPRFQRTSDVRWVDDTEQVIVVEVRGEARAYPIQVLALHEIVNDTIAGVPVAVTYCPLCASGVAFDRRAAGRVLSFGTSGLLYRSDLVMYDRQTKSLWPQIDGRAVAGVLTGTELSVLPASVLSWKQWRQAHPGGWVLSRRTGYGFSYGVNIYYRYDDKASLPLFVDVAFDNRMEWLKQPVVGIERGADSVAIDVEALARDGVREVDVDGRPVTVWWVGGARSSLDEAEIGAGREVGAVATFDPVLDGRPLTFRVDGGRVTDEETGSTWDMLGRALDGPLAGARLEPVPHVRTFWFAWSSFHEQTRVVR